MTVKDAKKTSASDTSSSDSDSSDSDSDSDDGEKQDDMQETPKAAPKRKLEDTTENTVEPTPKRSAVANGDEIS